MVVENSTYPRKQRPTHPAVPAQPASGSCTQSNWSIQLILVAAVMCKRPILVIGNKVGREEAMEQCECSAFTLAGAEGECKSNLEFIENVETISRIPQQTVVEFAHVFKERNQGQ